MSSLIISELVESRHDKVKQSIERLAESGTISLPPMGEVKIQRERRVETISVYLVSKRDSYVVVAQLSPKFTGALVDRWQELEAKHAAPAIDLNDPATLRGLLLETVEKRIELEAAVSNLTPKAEALDRIAEAGGSMCITDAAKALQMQPRALGAWLDSAGWTYRRHGNRERVPYQHRIQSGDMVSKAYTYKNSLGEESISERALVTAKGLTTLARKLSKEVGR